MAKTWLSITVELLGGRGQRLWPRPGRTFALGPAHTFADLAEAINLAFARWDLGHLSVFTLNDGSIITDEFNGPELGNSSFGTLQEVLDFERVKVARTVRSGEDFRFTFDLGDEWEHLCTVNPVKVDPHALLGAKPAQPVAYWGWGAMPDQYGRRWAEDDGSSPVPPDPGPDRSRAPLIADAPSFDRVEVTAATAAGDADRFLDAVFGHDLDAGLQQIGEGMVMALDRHRDRAETPALSVVNRLTFRAFPGDSELAEGLLAIMRGQPSPGLDIAVDLQMLAASLEGTSEDSSGGYIDLVTGDVFDAAVIDFGDEEIDVEAEPDRWLGFDRVEPGEAWTDMSVFVARLHQAELRERGRAAVEGKGAFQRFRTFIQESDLSDEWSLFSDDRELGRARALLAENGIRVV